MQTPLQTQLERLCAALPGVAGVVIEDGQLPRPGEINAHHHFPAASLIKLAILWAYLQHRQAGQISPDEAVIIEDTLKVGGTGQLQTLPPGTTRTLDDLARLMITDSDNTATNLLINRLGLAAINQAIAPLGLPATHLRRKMMDWPQIAAGIDNTTSPADVARLLHGLWQSPLLAPALRAQAISFLKAQQLNNKLPALLPAGVTLAHKTGELPGAEHDAGLLFLAHSTILVVVLTKELQENEAGVAFVRQIGRLVYDHYQGNA